MRSHHGTEGRMPSAAQSILPAAPFLTGIKPPREAKLSVLQVNLISIRFSRVSVQFNTWGALKAMHNEVGFLNI